MCEAELELFVNRDWVESCCLLQRLQVSVGTLLMRVPQYTISCVF